MSDLTTGLDGFAMAITSIVEPLPELCQEKVNKATVQATRKGAKTVQSYASKGGVHEWSGEYVTGFKSHITGGVVTEGEIGNANKPGLVHLLEKGHVTLNGRRTRSFPHMAPAFNEIQDDFIEKVENAVGEALR